MPRVLISGFNVDFPFEPYDVQKKYMEKVLQSLQTGKNAVLESPTGTGKTLCLLCSTLAWVEARNTQLPIYSLNLQQENGSGEFRSNLLKELEAGTAIPWDESIVVPKIIYSSRTHSQLSQAVKELKRSNYNYMKATVVGSRDQLCIHPEVSKEGNTTSKIHLCRAKRNARSCHFFSGMEEALEKLSCRQNPVVDIEDLLKIGNTNKCCPYYLSRNLKQGADIIFMPYNYLLDAKARIAHGIDLAGNIVIFDEAHNVDKICEESVSFELSSKDLAFCISEVSQIMQELAIIETSKGQSFDMTNVDRRANITFTLNDLVILKTLFCELEVQLDKVPLGSNNQATFPGQYIFEFLAKVELTVEWHGVILEMLEKLTLYMFGGSMNPTAKRFGGLQKFADMIKTIFSTDEFNNLCCYKSAASYKVHIGLSEQKTSNQGDIWTSTNKSLKQPRTLNFWCFNPGVGMQKLMEDSPRCILLTSGTLAPLDTFTHELQIPLPIRLENPHIIDKKQVWVGVISEGADGTVLNSSFQNRSNAKYIASLGRTIVNLARVVPKGLLVFFPSYTVMNECQRAWEQSHIWQSIANLKTIHLESKTKESLQKSIADFYVQNGDRHGRGAAFLAVGRGKVSEGLDFSDHNGRAVIVTGLPYPPWKDPKIELKMEYLDEQVKRTKKGIGGQSWYSLEAYRAVNEAIGRVIRHKDDYGAIILCDSRFGEMKFQSQISAWLKPHIQSPPNFGAAIKSLVQFFKEIRPQPNPRLEEAAQAACNNACIAEATTISSGHEISRKVPIIVHPSDMIPTRGTLDWLKMYTPDAARATGKPVAQPPQSRELFSDSDAYESKQNQNSFSAKPPLQPGNQALEASTYQDLMPVPAKKRKFDVIGPREAFEKKLVALGESCIMKSDPVPSCSTNESEHGNTQKRDMCYFLVDVKNYATPEEYNTFKVAINQYSQDQDLEVLVAAFSTCCTNPDVFDRIKAFRIFVNKHDRTQYDIYLKDLEKQSLAEGSA